MKLIKAESGIKPASNWGGKTNGLLRLLKADYNIPNFYILTQITTYESINFESELKILIETWRSEHQISTAALWAVRSSAAEEDGIDKSYAGQYLTELNIPFHGLEVAIKNVITSFQKTDNYKVQTHEFSIILQEMVPADYSGVIFSKHPQNILSQNCVLQITPGLGDSLVSGEALGLTIEGNSSKFEYGDLETNYGLKYNQETGNQIKKRINAHIATLIMGAMRLEDLWNTPVDIEFSIYKNEIFWLQVRPITARPKLKDYLIWDKTAPETSYPGITLPLSATYTTHTFKFAYHSVDKAIGYASRILSQNKPYISQMSGEINGKLYYNVTAWQQIIYQLPFGKKIISQLPSIWGMNPAPFPEPPLRHNFFERSLIGIRIFLMVKQHKKHDLAYQTATNQLIEKFTPDYFENLSHSELIAEYHSIEKLLDNQWFAPLSTGFYAMIFYNRLKKKLNNTSLISQHPNFLNDILMQDGTVISVEIVRAFQRLLTTIFYSDELKQIFENNEDHIIHDRLKIDSPDFYNLIKQYITQYGCRSNSSELKMETITYREDPLAFIRTLKMNSINFTPQNSEFKTVPFDQILKKHFPYQLLKRKRLSRLIKKTVAKTKARENYRFKRTETFAVIRNLFMACGNRLYLDKKIDAPRDVFHLTFENLLNTQLADQYREIIAASKKRYSLYDNDEEQVRYVEIAKQLYPILEKNTTIKEGMLSGVGCCSGVAEGKVKIIESLTDLDQDFKNCIVVSKCFEPGWINVFYQASGIVSERGNLLSHTAIISRELGIPSIVGVNGLIDSVRDCDTIKINGAKGIVYL